jgi:hypothetical protein
MKMDVKFCEHRWGSRTCYVASETKVPHTPYNCIIRKKYESIFSLIEFHERSEWNESLQMIAEGVSEGLFHFPEDVSPSTSLQHLML